MIFWRLEIWIGVGGRPNYPKHLRSQLHAWLVYVTTREPLVHHGL